MKNYLLLLFTLTCFNHAVGQDKAIAEVHYVFKHINDTGKRDVPQKDNVVSYLGENSYYYTSRHDQLMQKDIELQKSLAGFAGNLQITINSTPILEHYIIHPAAKKTKKIQGISSTFDAYLLDDTYQSQTWDIEPDEKQIGNYNCQKATTNFAGRHYTAWFTTELPFPFGPWKLHGLPGLILEASDDKLEVVFEYAGFDKLSSPKPIVVPDFVLVSTPATFNKLRKAFQDNPQAYYASLHAAGKMDRFNQFYGIDYSTMQIDFNTSDYKPSESNNNPIELVEKK
ncbi:GLPGLI family protein [Sphingobacterium oryzagri]|uniref:GLPGLI family protein n=1 Tax=Sphingobacterium oryzagri TaxID=3025669 RepID=A0ABY7WCS3_9SPHI|nr:GLPGLI family protein [Sphingobacterium sp. KACC 22765]WDF67462.1 GLPGLI family protein [Sphingobacterium sp. KACC 22765]